MEATIEYLTLFCFKIRYHPWYISGWFGNFSYTHPFVPVQRIKHDKFKVFFSKREKKYSFFPFLFQQQDFSSKMIRNGSFPNRRGDRNFPRSVTRSLSNRAGSSLVWKMARIFVENRRNGGGQHAIREEIISPVETSGIRFVSRFRRIGEGEENLFKTFDPYFKRLASRDLTWKSTLSKISNSITDHWSLLLGLDYVITMAGIFE